MRLDLPIAGTGGQDVHGVDAMHAPGNVQADHGETSVRREPRGVPLDGAIPAGMGFAGTPGHEPWVAPVEFLDRVLRIVTPGEVAHGLVKSQELSNRESFHEVGTKALDHIIDLEDWPFRSLL